MLNTSGGDDRPNVPIVRLNKLTEAGSLAKDQSIRKNHTEWFVLHERLCAADGIREASGILLLHRNDGNRRADAAKRDSFLFPSRPLQKHL
jgi:hypothetical protein